MSHHAAVCLHGERHGCKRARCLISYPQHMFSSPSTLGCHPPSCVQDSVIMTDISFVPLLQKFRDKLPSVRHFIVTTDKEHMPASTPEASWLCYDKLVSYPCCRCSSSLP